MHSVSGILLSKVSSFEIIALQALERNSQREGAGILFMLSLTEAGTFHQNLRNFQLNTAIRAFWSLEEHCKVKRTLSGIASPYEAQSYSEHEHFIGRITGRLSKLALFGRAAREMLLWAKRSPAESSPAEISLQNRGIRRRALRSFEGCREIGRLRIRMTSRQ